MTQQPIIHSIPAMPARAEQAAGTIQGAWSTLQDELLRGMLHAVNNRIAALGAYVDLATLDAEPLTVADIKPELARLLATSTLMSKLTARSGHSEPLEVRPLLDTALAIHAHHGRIHAECGVHQPAPILPVRVPRWALLRVLLLMIDSAKKAAAPATLSLDGDGERICVRGAATMPSIEDVAELAGLCGASFTLEENEYLLSIPVLRKG